MPMNFEELQNSWKAQPVNPGGAAPGVQDGLLKQVRRQQRTVLWSNIATTLGFTATFCVFGWLYASLHAERGSLFGGSLLFMSLIMLIYLWVIWKGFSFRRMDMNVPISYFLTAYTTKLKWRRKLITTYTWIYGVLLWLALMLYMIDVTAGAACYYE
jgi:membrane-associated HD superfamily phosphohydrolase